MIEHRKLVRISLGPEHTLRFVAGGHVFQDIRIANLSEGGCFITVPQADAGVFLRGTLLEQMHFEGVGLPAGALTGSVAYAMGAIASMAVVGVGVTFLNLSEATRGELARFVEERLRRD